jgi:hypothetical protein
MAKKTEVIAARVEPALKHEIQIAAAAERRSISDTVYGVLLSWAADRSAQRERQAA